MIFNYDFKWTEIFGNMSDVNVMARVPQDLPYSLSNLEMPVCHDMADAHRQEIVLLWWVSLFHVKTALESPHCSGTKKFHVKNEIERKLFVMNFLQYSVLNWKYYCPNKNISWAKISSHLIHYWEIPSLAWHQLNVLVQVYGCEAAKHCGPKCLLFHLLPIELAV